MEEKPADSGVPDGGDNKNELPQGENEQGLTLPDTIYFTWSAPEFIEHHKSATWYMKFGLVIAVMAGIVFFITRSIFPVVMFAIVGVVFGFIAARKPRNIYYEINNLGVMQGKRATRFDEFKSFSVIDEKNLGSVVFNPLRRFVLPTTIYYELANEDKIIDTISQFLPIVETTNDPVDQLMRKIRF